ncbi:MAG: FkbM family methyltransferase [Isosphaeraceae bacterium]
MHPVNRLLNMIGLRVVRVPPHQQAAAGAARKSVVPIRVGPFELLIEPRNPLFETYLENPSYMAELGRVAAEVHAKYPGMVCVDVGANVGDTAAILRAACPARIICVEGDESVAETLARNAERIGDVAIVRVFLDERDESRRVNVAKAGWNSTLLPVGSNGHAQASEHGRVVRFSTLDEVLGSSGVDRAAVKLLKIDTEGFDARVLRGASRVLDEGRPVVLFEYNRENLAALGEDGLSIFDALRQRGYRTAMFWEAQGRFILGTTLDQSGILEDLHDYVGYHDGYLSAAQYLDVCVFHETDEDLAARCLSRERAERTRPAGSPPDSTPTHG